MARWIFIAGCRRGVLDYQRLLEQVRTLPHQPSITLEMDSTSDMEASLSYFQLAQQDQSAGG